MQPQTVFESCPLFAGLNETDLAYALQFFEAHRAVYRKGDFLNRIGDPLRSFGLVLEGTIQVSMDDFDGHHLIMANVAPGGTYGESLCYLGQPAAITICATTDAEVLLLSTRRLKDGLLCADARNRLLNDRFICMLAGRTLEMNDRIQILSKPGIRARLITFFSQVSRRQGRSFTLGLDRSSMAAYLGTDRSALSRELSRMQKEGLIHFEKNRFQLLGGMEPPD